MGHLYVILIRVSLFIRQKKYKKKNKTPRMGDGKMMDRLIKKI
jgi:hypothetical protein